jgi:hypothetical protein
VNTVKLPANDDQGNQIGTFFISNQILSTFEEDFLTGSLSSRAWCLQERLLSRRILHFGKDLLHWECYAGMWSENSTDCRTRDHFTDHDDAGDLRKAFVPTNPFRTLSAESLIPYLAEIGESLASRKPYGDWYRMVEIYSTRQLTNPADKLPALSGASRRFTALCKDVYIAGLWINDTPAGMMWSGTGLFKPIGQHGHLRRPSKYRAPSWSWASVDGRVHYPVTPFGADLLEAPAIYNHPVGPDEFGEVDFGMLEVTGRLKPLDTMLGFRDSDSEWLEQVARTYQPLTVRADFDEPEVANKGPVHCLLVAPDQRKDRRWFMGFCFTI